MSKRKKQPAPPSRLERMLLWMEKHSRLFCLILGLLFSATAFLLTKDLRYEETISITAHFTGYETDSYPFFKQTTVFFSDHEPLKASVSAFSSTAKRHPLSVFPSGTEMTMRLHPRTEEIVALTVGEQMIVPFSKGSEAAGSAIRIIFYLLSLALFACAIFGPNIFEPRYVRHEIMKGIFHLPK